jgi:hypothetical protein
MPDPSGLELELRTQAAAANLRRLAATHPALRDELLRLADALEELNAERLAAAEFLGRLRPP